MHWRLLLLVSGWLVAACSTPAATPPPAAPPQSAARRANPVYEVGTSVAGTDLLGVPYLFTVYDVQRPYSPAEALEFPIAEGTVLAALDVELANRGTVDLYTSPALIFLLDTQHGVYQGLAPADLAGTFVATTIPPGEASRGWVLYELPADFVPWRVRYDGRVIQLP
jgi:hypothetical protein